MYYFCHNSTLKHMVRCFPIGGITQCCFPAGIVKHKMFLVSKLDGVCHIDKRPSTDKLHHFVREKRKKRKKYIYIYIYEM